MSNHPLYHLHRQSRIIKVRKPLLPDKWIRLLDKITLYTAILGPILTIPQIYKIWILQSAEGLSLLTWGSYSLLNIPILIYGIAHREKIIITMQTLWALVNCSVAIGIILYS